MPAPQPAPAVVTSPVATLGPRRPAGAPGPIILTGRRKKGMSATQKNLLTVLAGLIILVVLYFLVTQFS